MRIIVTGGIGNVGGVAVARLLRHGHGVRILDRVAPEAIAELNHDTITIVDMQRGIDYIGVGVGAIIVDDQDHLFLAQRGPRAKNERGLWEFPGGSVEFGERLTDALKREMREEYGVEIAVGELLDVVDHILPAEGQHWVSPTFICRIISGVPTIREPGKCTEIGWFAPEAVPEDELTLVTRENLRHYRQWLTDQRKYRR